jgi:5-hydroxyisourate hydrolase
VSTCSTHVLDAALGRPAAGVVVLLTTAEGARVDGAATDADGRARFDADLDPGSYELVFATGDWFAEQDRPTFFPAVRLCFTVAEEEPHYHVALLLSPYSYTTYRGS